MRPATALDLTKRLLILDRLSNGPIHSRWSPTFPHDGATATVLPVSNPELLPRGELYARGVTPWILRDRLRRGTWFEPVPGVIATGPVAGLGLVVAALLRAGPDAALSHQSGAQAWLDRELTGTIHVLTPYGVKIRPTAGIRYHQSRQWEQPMMRGGLPVVAPATCAAQVAAAEDCKEADRRALVTGLVQRRLTTPEGVAAAAARSPRRRWAQVCRLVEEVLAGAESGPEATLWRAQVEHRMPVPDLNHPLPGGRRLDGFLPALRAGYEVQSREHHADTWIADTTRFADILLQHAIVLLPVLVQDVEHRIGGLLADLEGFWRTRASDLGVPMPVHVHPQPWRP